MEISNALKEEVARLLNYVLVNEESSYEETIDEHGIDSDQANAHIYTLARNLWCELELDFFEGE